MENLIILKKKKRRGKDQGANLGCALVALQVGEGSPAAP